MWELDNTTIQISLEQLRAIRKEAELRIDPNTAEVIWHRALILDPYGDGFEIPEEGQCYGRVFFARSPGSDIWVSFYDLPEETVTVLRDRLDNGDFDSEYAF